MSVRPLIKPLWLIFESGPTKQNANNVLYVSGHTLFSHGVHEPLVVECSLMRVLLYPYRYSLPHSRSWLTGAFTLFFQGRGGICGETVSRFRVIQESFFARWTFFPHRMQRFAKKNLFASH